MSVFRLKILTPEKRIYDSQVVSVTVTGASGQLTVLAGHAPMVAMITEGLIRIRTEQGTAEGITGRGILRVDRSETAVLIHAFKWADEGTDELSAESMSVKDGLL